MFKYQSIVNLIPSSKVIEGAQPNSDVILSLENYDLYEIKDYLFNQAKVWPHKDSVYVSDKYIVVVFDEEVLEKTKEILLEKMENNK